MKVYDSYKSKYKNVIPFIRYVTKIDVMQLIKGINCH